MVIRLFIAFLIFLSPAVFSQKQDSLYQKKEIKKSELSAVFGYYEQDGKHSAVTGGEGTEELSVKSTRIIYVHKTKKSNKWSFKTGVDQITSASTDQINFIESSASYVDHRVQLDVSYTKVDSSSTKNVSMGTSIESDYWSRSIGASYSKKFKKDLKLKVKFDYFWDDLRWGWVKLGQFKGETMIYPIELRGIKWFEKHHRNSFNLGTSLNWNSSKRSKMGVDITPTFQTGILSTPFHRVYFTDGTKRVERLADQRFKFPFGFSFNYFLTNRIIVKSYARLYWDSFGMTSSTLKLTVPVKLKYWIWVSPFCRYYVQSGLNYFSEYGEHNPSANYYTSDFDFSQFSSLNYGLNFKFRKKMTWKYLDLFQLFIEKYNRSDGLLFWQTAVHVDVKF